VDSHRAESCTALGNSIHSGEVGEGEDCGINIGNLAGDLHVSDNTLCYFEDGKFMEMKENYNEYSINVINNTYYNKAVKFDPLSPARPIHNTSINPNNSMAIVIPDLTVPLVNNEEFYLYVPEDYHAPTRSFITYTTMSGVTKTVPLMTKDGSSPTTISRFAGKYVRLKYNSDGDNIQFMMCI